MRRFFTAFLLFLASLAPSVYGQRTDVEYQPRVVLQKPMPAITNAPTVGAADAVVAPNELVIGVVVEGKSRAYPINQLTGPKREIINDSLTSVIAANDVILRKFPEEQLRTIVLHLRLDRATL